jgi:hypothetical protein
MIEIGLLFALGKARALANWREPLVLEEDR